MKTKLFVPVLLLAAAMAPGALAAADGGDGNVHQGVQLLVTPVDDPAVKNAPTRPAVVLDDAKQKPGGKSGHH
jgi:hypothetical protein